MGGRERTLTDVKVDMKGQGSWTSIMSRADFLTRHRDIRVFEAGPARRQTIGGGVVINCWVTSGGYCG